MPTLSEQREALRRRARASGFGSNVTAYQQSLLRDRTGLTDQQMAAIRRAEAAASGMDIYDYNDAVREGLLTIDYRDDHPALVSATPTQSPTQAPVSDSYYTPLDQVSGFGPSGGGSSAYGDAISENVAKVDSLRQMNPIDLTDEQGLLAYGPQWSMIKETDRNDTVQVFDSDSLWSNSSTGGNTMTGAGPSGGLTDGDPTGDPIDDPIDDPIGNPIGDPTGGHTEGSDGDVGGDIPVDNFDYDAFRALLQEMYGEFMTPREAPDASGMIGQQANATSPSRFLSNEMRDREGVERAIDYGLPASRQPLNFSQFSGPRTRPRGVRPYGSR